MASSLSPFMFCSFSLAFIFFMALRLAALPCEAFRVSTTTTRQFVTSSKNRSIQQQIRPRSSSPITRLMSSSSSVIPRAAVSVVVRYSNDNANNSTPYYVLVQRGKEPNKGMWSLPGGKINAGESTLHAAQRELQEETLLHNLKWHDGPFRSTDSIHVNDNQVLYHYVISQCFCISPKKQTLIPSDDAADAQWWSLQQVQEKTKQGIVTPGVVSVIEKAELLYTNGFLPCK